MNFELGELPFKAKIIEKDFKNIPEKGPFIAVVNRFSEYYEELAMIELLHNQRPDIRIISLNANTKDYVNAIYIKSGSVNDWDKTRDKIIKEIKLANKEDYPIVIFPTRKKKMLGFDQLGWDKEIVKTIFLSRLPIIPIYCKWDNKFQNYPLGFSLSSIYTNTTAKNFLNVKIGKSILEKQIKGFQNSEAFRKYLYALTFSLGHTIELDSFFKTKLKKKSEEVLSPISNELVHYDVKNLPKESLILEDGQYQVYYSSALNLPSALKQIGILREQSMRDQERGTGKKMDIDEFDVFYYQVFIWDKKQLKILGGFRMSFCDWILQHYGKKGLYSNRLFQYDNKMNEFLLESIEIGKIFFANKLKEDDQMIHLMWKIISTIHLKFNQYKHIISTLEMDLISSDFSKKSLVVFLKQFYTKENIKEHISARTPYKYRFSSKEKLTYESLHLRKEQTIFEENAEEIIPFYTTIPESIRNYIYENMRFLDFALDKDHEDALVGLYTIQLQTLNESNEN